MYLLINAIYMCICSERWIKPYNKSINLKNTNLKNTNLENTNSNIPITYIKLTNYTEQYEPSDPIIYYSLAQYLEIFNHII